MADIRTEGKTFLKEKFNEPQKGEHLSVSKFYTPKGSWTHSPAWGNDIPVSNLKLKSNLHLLCKCESGKGFHYFRVPVNDIKNFKERGNLYVKLKKETEYISLFLSARPEDLFQDLKGNGKVNFGKYLQTSVN